MLPADDIRSAIFEKQPTQRKRQAGGTGSSATERNAAKAQASWRISRQEQSVVVL